MFGTSGEYCVPEPGVRFYNPRHYCAHKAIVIRLQEEGCERLVVEVEDPEGVLERINREVGSFIRGVKAGLVSSTALVKKGLGLLSEEPQSFHFLLALFT